MATNKNALIRYITIDKCLQNKYRQWTLENLIEACSDALYEYEGKDVYVSKRTIQLDIQNMRSDKMGYNAPIEVYDKKYYKYSIDDYSITKSDLSETDLEVLNESVQILKQFKNFSLFSDLSGIISKIEDKIFYQSNQKSIIHIDKNDNLKGLEFINEIYQAISKKIVLDINYKSFKSREKTIFTIHPFILKEFNNRWFVVGEEFTSAKLLTLALDRIISIDYNLKIEYTSQTLDADKYYKNTIGVTVMNNDNVKEIILKVSRIHAPYVITKPLHWTQNLIENQKDGSIIISIKVDQNFELERLILGFGDGMEVLAPRKLKMRIRKKFENGYKMYSKSNKEDNAKEE